MRNLLILINVGVAFYFIFTELGRLLQYHDYIVFIPIIIFIILPLLIAVSLKINTGTCILEMWPFISFKRKNIEERKKIENILNTNIKEPNINSIEEAIYSLINNDIQELEKGKIPEKRLIPHHAIKRDIILCAYNRDFYKLSPKMQELNKDNFEKKIDIIKHMEWEDLNRLIEIMKEERDDLKEIESSVREKKIYYSIVPPIFP